MKLTFPFDPVERSREVEAIVMKEGKRLYHRFRPAPYYGGIATADAIGCSFLCAYCWNYYRNLDPSRFRDLYSSHRVASNLLNIARKKFFNLFRITESEPILGESSFEHLIEVVKNIFRDRPDSVFILETNGFFLGWKADLIERLKFRNLWVRVSLKGVDEESFEVITGAKREFFQYPLNALKELEAQGIKAWPAVMKNLFTIEEVARLRRTIETYGIRSQLEQEVLEEYPFVVENLKKRKVLIKG